METTLQRFTMPDGIVVEVHFDFDAYFNATEAAKPFGKVPKDWLRTQAGKEYLEAVSKWANMPISELVITREGSPSSGGGTWMHPKVAIEFARWLNPFFAVQCNEVIEAILRGRASALPSPHCGLAEGRLITVVETAIRDGFSQLKLDLLTSLAPQRRPITDSVKDVHLRCLDWRGWRCPLTGRQMTRKQVQFDHHYGNQLPGLEQTWPLSELGHADVTCGRISRVDVDQFFRAYQTDLSLMLSQERNPENFLLIPFTGRKK